MRSSHLPTRLGIAVMPVVPGAVVPLGRAAYYRAEATRIDLLAAAADAGRERFETVAQEYRLLAEILEAPDDDAVEDVVGDDLVAGPMQAPFHA